MLTTPVSCTVSMQKCHREVITELSSWRQTRLLHLIHVASVVSSKGVVLKEEGTHKVKYQVLRNVFRFFRDILKSQAKQRSCCIQPPREDSGRTELYNLWYQMVLPVIGMCFILADWGSCCVTFSQLLIPLDLCPVSESPVQWSSQSVVKLTCALILHTLTHYLPR